VIRLAEPIMHANKNLVWIKDKSSLQTEEIRETHNMRYWFLPEIEYLIKEAGFGMLNDGEWMTSKRPGFDTWGVYIVARIQ
jgi:hypothetical protein